MGRGTVSYAVAYWFLYVLTAHVAFRFGDGLPAVTGYVLLGFLYLVPVAIVLRCDLTDRSMALFLVVVPWLSLLIVIDPVEMGLFGHDPYSYTLPSYEYFRSGASLSAFAERAEAWPLFYSLTALLQEVTGTSTATVAKYVPLIVVTIPFVFFVGLRRYVDSEIAFLAAITVAATRSYVQFQAKFVDETIAVVLFFSLIAVLALTGRDWRRSALVVLVVVALSLSHHATSAVGLLFIGCWALAGRIERLSVLPRRFRSVSEPSAVRLQQVVIVGMLIVGMFSFLAPMFAGRLVGIAVAALSGTVVTTAPVSDGSSAGLFTLSGLSLRQVLSRLALVFLALFALIDAAGVVSRYRVRQWEFGWITFAGIMSVIYLGTIVGGRLVPLDPIRLLVFLVPALIAPALVVVVRSGTSDRLPFASVLRYTVAGVLVCAFIVTQIAAIPPHVLYSDPAVTTLGEGHATPAQFAASSWANDHTDAPIFGSEPAVWRARDNEFRAASKEDCRDGLLAWRREGGITKPPRASAVYDGGKVALFTCRS